MTIDEIRTIEDAADIETRKAQIATEAAEADAEKLTSLNAELDELEKRAAEIEAAKEKRKAAAAEVISGKGEKIETPKENKKMDLNEIRNSKEYIDAYAKYIRTGDDRECRTALSGLVTELGPGVGDTYSSGLLPVPQLVEDSVRTAWEKNAILSRVRRTYIRGVLRVAFEVSATAAAVHNEGTAAPSEEELVLGIATLSPKNIKKWITISDEAVAMGGEAFLRYIYDELTYQISKALAAGIISVIGVNCANGIDTTHAGGAVSKAAPSLTAVATAYSLLGDNASNVAIVMNKATYADFIAAQVAGNFAYDPFMGLPVLFDNSLPAYGDGSEDDVYAVIGDFSGVQVNYPEGDGVVIKYDELSLAEKDLVKIVGRQYVGFDVVNPGSFVCLTVPA